MAFAMVCNNCSSLFDHNTNQMHLPNCHHNRPSAPAPDMVQVQHKEPELVPQPDMEPFVVKIWITIEERVELLLDEFAFLFKDENSLPVFCLLSSKKIIVGKCLTNKKLHLKM